MKIIQLILGGVILAFATGCILTKAVTVPMRLGGAVISIIPVAGNTADEAIDKTADTIDKLPF